MKSRINANIYGIFCYYYFSRPYLSRVVRVLGHETLHYVNDDGTGGISEEDAQEGQNIYNSNENMSEEELKAELIAKGKTPEEAEKIAGEIFEDIRAHTFDTKIWTSLKSQYMIANQEMDTKAYLLQEGQDVFNQYVGSEYVLGQDKTQKILEIMGSTDYLKNKELYESSIEGKETLLKKIEEKGISHDEFLQYLKAEISLGKGFLEDEFHELNRLLKFEDGKKLFKCMLYQIAKSITEETDLVRNEDGTIKAAKIAVNENLQVSDLTSGDMNKYFFITSEYINESENKGYIKNQKYKMNYTTEEAKIFSVGILSEINGKNKKEILKKLDYASSKIQNYYQNPEDLVKQVEEKYKRMQEKFREDDKSKDSWLDGYTKYSPAYCSSSVGTMLHWLGYYGYADTKNEIEDGVYGLGKNKKGEYLRANEMIDELENSGDFQNFINLPEMKELRNKYYTQDKDGNWVRKSDEDLCKELGITSEKWKEMKPKDKKAAIAREIHSELTNISNKYRKKGFVGIYGSQRTDSYKPSGHISLYSGGNAYDINFGPKDSYGAVPLAQSYVSSNYRYKFGDLMEDLCMTGVSDANPNTNVSLYMSNSSILLTMSNEQMLEFALEDYEDEEDD